MPAHPPSPRICAIIVLYKQAPEASEAYASLLAVIAQHPELAAEFSLVLYDNSPAAQTVAGAPFPVHYIHDASNGGLARAYNFALTQAEEISTPWLLLLDQDTAVTAEYLQELLSWTDKLRDEALVAAIVPKLVAIGRIYSPEQTFLFHLRHQLPHSREFPIAPDVVGVQPEMLNAYNSGATLRTAALRKIGGFPEEYWLDYLDHAVFHALQQLGYRMCVMSASLQQKLSHLDLNEVPLWRHRSVLESQTRFVRRAGKLSDRWLYRLWLLRKARQYRGLCRDRRVWRRMAMQAVLLRVPRKQQYGDPLA